MCNVFKVHIFWEDHENFAKIISFSFDVTYYAQKKVSFFSIFVAFSEHMNFNNLVRNEAKS